MIVARRGHVYPQARVVAADVIDMPVATARPSITVRAALELVRRRGAPVLAVGSRYALRDDLSRADLLGLGALPAASVARPLPAVAAADGEVAARRRLLAGVPLVIVRGHHGPAGAVAGPGLGAAAPVSAGARVARGLAPATRELLVRIGRHAAELGARAFLVGGQVRDLWRGAVLTPRDLDVVVEGDGPAVARRLARELGGALREHDRFLTASLTTAAGDRIDVATARAERYETRGGLPRVLPASIHEDLRRRDFSVNAMAIELGSGTWELLDPLGGRADLAARRLRVLHPLSYVEDPTRLFRAARYAARLGLVPEGGTEAARRLALSLVPYPALSGQRIANELLLVLDEARPAAALLALGDSGTLRLLDPRVRFTATTRRRCRALPGALAWARAHGLTAAPLELLALALLGDQPPAVPAAALARLAFTGEPLARLMRALAEHDALAARLTAGGAPSARAAALRGRAPLELAWLALRGGTRTREALAWYLGLERRRGALSGDEVVALGVPAGPAVARVLAELRDGRLDGRIRDRDMEAEHVRRWVAKGGG